MASLPKILTDETSVLHGLCAHSPPELVYKESLEPNYYGFQLCHTAPHCTSTMDHELYCGKYESFTVKYELTLVKYESTMKESDIVCASSLVPRLLRGRGEKSLVQTVRACA